MAKKWKKVSYEEIDPYEVMDVIGRYPRKPIRKKITKYYTKKKKR